MLALLLHDEPIYLEDKIIGRTTSKLFILKKTSVWLCKFRKYKKDLKGKNIYIEVEKKKYLVIIR